MVAEMPEVLAIVPARGGSKSIPRKNIRQFGGHPLLSWSIAAGRQARYVRRVVVSTDDREIAGIAVSCGAEVPFLRPAELALDETTDFPVFQHALEFLEKHEGYKPEVVIQLRPTSPLRPPGLIDKAVELLVADECADSVRSVTPPAQNPYKMWTLVEEALKPILSIPLHEPFNAPRQALPPTYWQTGHVDAFRRRTVFEKRSLTGDRILPVVVDSRYAVDIDEWIHWRLAEERLGLELDAVKPGGAGISLLSSIRLIVFDFDGVFTDNRVYVDQNGHELVACNRSDGLGIERLVRHGIDAAVLSTESNPLVAARCRKLNLPVRQGLTDKAAALRDLVRSMRLTLDEVAYVGNDMNDLECLEIVRVAIVPADAYPSVRGVSDIVLHSRGGCGAVREVCELAIAAHSPEQEG